MFKRFLLVIIVGLNIISVTALWAQPDRIFRQNQKLIAEAHIEFVYQEPDSLGRIRSFKNSNVTVSHGKMDTTTITQMWFDAKGQLTKYAETTKEDKSYTVAYEHYLYDEKGNVTYKIDSVEYPNYEWALLQAMKKEIKSAKQKQELNAAERELIRKGANKPEKRAGDVKKFVYDSQGYLIYYTNLNVGYKAVVNYRLDEKRRLSAFSTLDTNPSNYDRKRLTHLYKYDEQDRVIQISKKSESVSGNENRFDDERVDMGDVIFSYDTSGEYNFIINRNNRYSDTLSYVYLYNKQKQRTSVITLNGSDTTNIIEYTYENGLVKTATNIYRNNSKSPAPSSKSMMDYTYYPNKEVKTVAHYEFWEEEEIPEPILRNIEIFEYTYH